MCLTIPAKIISLNNNIAQVQIRSKKREVKCALSNIMRGDWVLVNADLAVEKVSEKEASEINKLINQ